MTDSGPDILMPSPVDAPAAAPATAEAVPAATSEAAPPAAPVPARDYRRVVEALLFASERPLTLGKIHDAAPELKQPAIRELLDQLRSDYAAVGHAFELVEIAEGWQILTRPEYDEWIARLKKSKSQAKLSGAALETLAIIAYKQPVRRVDIEAIRGVQSGELVRALMDRGLVRIAGREDQPGSPLLYGTTKEFLEILGLKDLNDLPKPEEVK